MPTFLSSALNPKHNNCFKPRLLIALFVLFGSLSLLSGCNEKTAEDHLQEGMAHVEKTQWLEALVSFKNAAILAPRSPNIRYQLGMAQLKLNNYEEASKDLSLALEYKYAEEKIIPSLALALSRTNANVALSELNYDRTLLTDEEQVEVGVRKIAAYISLNKTSEASTLLQELEPLEVNTPYKGMLTAYKHILANQDSDALTVLESTLKSAPDNRDVINLAASLYVIDGDKDTAISLYKNYTKLAPDDIQAKFILIDLLIQTNKADQADEYIDELLLENSNSGILNQYKALARSAIGDHRGAKEYAEKAINGGRRDDKLRLIAGLSAHKIKEYEIAVKHLSVIEGTLPNDHIALQALADSKLQLDLVADAAKLLTRVDDGNKDSLQVFPRTSYELIKTGDTQTASQFIEQANNKTLSAESLLSQGVLKLSLNDPTALADIERAYALDRSSYNARNTLAGAYVLTKQFKKALAFARDWQIDEPQKVEGFLLEADVRSFQNQPQKAYELVQKALKIEPENSFAILAMTKLDMQKGDFEKALTEVQTLLEAEPTNPKGLASLYKIHTELKDDAKLAETVNKIKEATEQEPENEDLTVLYASILVANSEFKAAVTELNRIEPNRFTLATYWRLKGAALYQSGDDDALYEHYKYWVSLFPKQLDPTLGLVQILNNKRDFKAAATAAQNYLKQADSVYIKMSAAYFLAMSKDISAAKKAVRAVDDKYQDVPYMKGVKARIALLEGRGMDVVEDAKIAYNEAKTYDNLELVAQVLDSAKRTKQAFPIIEQHVKDFPNDARSRALYALRQVAVDKSAALASYESLLQEFPNNPDFLNNAAYLLFDAGNNEKAFEYSAKAYELRPSNLNIADTYAQIMIQRGDTQKAVEAYNNAFTDDVSNEGVILNYIEALFLNNNQVAADRRIQMFRTRLKSQASKNRLLTLQAQYSK